MAIGALSVGDIMSTGVHVTAPLARLDDVRSMMRLAGIRHAPVVEDDRLVGVVSERDIFLAWGRGKDTPVRELMSSDPRWVTPATSAREAAAIMLRHKIGCLPVLDETSRRVVGIVTETDFLQLAHQALSEGEQASKPAPSPN